MQKKSPVRYLKSASALLALLATCSMSAAQAESVSGRMVYKANCAMCHKVGLNAAPKYGEDMDWKPILDKGKATVYDNAINGIGSMPARGGRDLSDAEVKAAVDYMVGAVGGW